MSATAQQKPDAPAWGPWLGGAVLVLAAIVGLIVLLNIFAPAPQGPADSSYATTAEGVAAWAELLSRSGHPVQPLREPLASVSLKPSSTLIVLGADQLSGQEAAHLREFAQSGGRLVIGGGEPQQTLSAIGADPPRWTAAGPASYTTTASVPETDGVGAIQTAGEGTWTSKSSSAITALGASTGGGSLLAVRQFGAGRVVMLADSSPLQNGLLASADNAKLALNLAGSNNSPVYFAEAIHGFGRASGLAAIPGAWWLMFGLMFAAAATWALSRGRRLGPADEPPPAPAPARSAYVAGMAGVLLGTRDRDGIARLAGKLVDSER